MSDESPDFEFDTDDVEDFPDKTKEDGTLEEPEPDFDYSDVGPESSDNSENGGDPFESFDPTDSDSETFSMDPSDTGVNEEELEEEQRRLGFAAFHEIKERIWTRESIPTMPSLPSRDKLPNRSDLSGWRPNILSRAEEEAGEETAEADQETAEEDPETSVDEDQSVDEPEVDEAVDEVADESPELPSVQIQMPDQSDIAPLEDTFREEREFLRHNKSIQDVESAVNNAITSLSKGNQGLISKARETNENLEQITSQMMNEVVQNDVDRVEGWIDRWQRVKQYIEFISTRSGAGSTNTIAVEKNLLNGNESFDADGSNFLNNYAGLQENTYGLRQVREDLQAILQNLRPLGGSVDENYSNEVRLMKNLVSELEKSQRVYSRMVILRMNLDVIEEEQGDFVRVISEIEGGAIRDQNLRQNMKSELQAIQEGEKELADIARTENAILKNMMEANKIIKRIYEIDAHEFENLYKSGEGREGIEEDLRNLIESFDLERDSEVYDEFQEIRSMMREVAEISEKITVEKADEIEWYIRVSKMISNIIESDKHYYESMAEEEDSYEEEVDEEVSSAESSEIPELNEIERKFVNTYNQYIEIDGDDIKTELENIRPELKDMVQKTADEEDKFRDLESDVGDLKTILEGIQELENKATQGKISEEEFRNQVVKGAGKHSMKALTEKLKEINSFLEQIEEEEHVLKEEHEDLKAKFSHLLNQLEQLKALRKEALEIHQRVEEDDIADEFGSRVNSEIGMNFMRFIGNLENAGGLEDLINQDREMLQKETKLEAEEIEMLKEISNEMEYLADASYDQLDLTDHGRKKINDMVNSLEKFDEEIKRVRKVKAKALNIDKDELESF